jgi:uncharacterized membrane protein YhaH (DUF805 family)
MSYYKQVLKKYVTFNGRASREEFWSFSKWQSLIVLGTMVLDALGGVGVFTGLYLLATILPTFAVMVRRMHDSGRGASFFWWALFPVAGVIIILIYLRAESQPDTNQYGPNPAVGTTIIP